MTLSNSPFYRGRIETDALSLDIKGILMDLLGSNTF